MSIDAPMTRAYRRLSRIPVLTNTRLRARIGRRLRGILGIPKEQVPSRLLLSNVWKFVYVGIPKTASTSIRHALNTSLGPKVVKQNTWLEDLLATDDRFHDYFKFAFVRNPWSRTVSVYKDKIKGRDPDFTLESFNGLSRGMTFEEFIEWLCESPEGLDENADRHWLSQYRFVAPKGELLVDHVAKFENLDEGWSCIMSRVGLSEIKLPVKNRSTSRTQENTKDYRHYYDRRARRLIGERYSEDVELFGYRF